MPSATNVQIGTTASTPNYTGTMSPVGDGITPGTIYLGIADGLGGENGLGVGVGDDGAGNLVMADGNGFGARNFATGDGTTSTFTDSLGEGMVEPGSVNVYQNAVLVASDDGAGNLVSASGSMPFTDQKIGTGNSSTQHFTHTLSLGLPITPGTVQIYTGNTPNSYVGGTLAGTDDGAGNITGSGIAGSPLPGSTIDYATGVVSVWLIATPSYNYYVWANYTGAGSSGVTGTVTYTPGNATVIFPTAPAVNDSITIDVAGYGFVGTIDYLTGVFTLQLGNSAPITPTADFALVASYGWALPIPVPGAPGLSLAPVVPPTLAALLQALGNSYGVDVMCLTDLDPNFSLVQNALAQDAYHLVTEQPGSIFWSPIQTFSLRSMLSRGIVPASLAATAAAIQSVIASDERVSQAQCTITQTGPETVEVTIQVFPEQGTPFQLVAAVGKVSITLISVGLINL